MWQSLGSEVSLAAVLPTLSTAAGESGYKEPKPHSTEWNTWPTERVFQVPADAVQEGEFCAEHTAGVGTHLGTVCRHGGGDIWGPVLLQQVNVDLGPIPSVDTQQTEQLVDIMMNAKLTHSFGPETSQGVLLKVRGKPLRKAKPYK